MSLFFLINLTCTAQVVLTPKEVTLMIQLILVNLKQYLTSCSKPAMKKTAQCVHIANKVDAF